MLAPEPPTHVHSASLSPRSPPPPPPPLAAEYPANTARLADPSGFTAVVGVVGIVTPTTVAPYYFAVDGVDGGTVTLDAGYYLLDGVVTGTSNYLPACALATPTDEVNRRPRAPNGSARV